ncbi:MAG: rhomboid family intramembrane serine protease [Natrialbaceae archaeon]
MANGSGTPVIDLLVVFSGVFALQVLAGLAASVTPIVGLVGGLFVLAPPLSENPWTVVTSVYAHADFGHLLSNAVALVVFGWPVARATTRVRFHAFFLFCGALAGTVQVLTTVFLAGLPFVAAEPTAVLGASGGVFGLLGYLLASNRLSSSLASSVALSPLLSLGLFVVVAAVLTVATAAPGVALFAHFAGLLVGLLAGSLGVLDVSRTHPEPARV